MILARRPACSATPFHALAEKLNCPLRFFDNETMQQTIDRYKLQESAFVRQTIGIGNVAEAAAFCSVPAGRMTWFFLTA